MKCVRTALWSFQEELLAEIAREQAQGHRAICVQAPTGSGKTQLGSEDMRRTADEGGRCVCIMHRHELIDQWYARLESLGVSAGVIQAHDRRRDPKAFVQLASVQTLVRREYPPADLVIIDEAHHAKAATYERVLTHYANAQILGLTATPQRLDGLGLGDIFTSLVCGPSIPWLQTEGYLACSRVFAGSAPNLSGIRTLAGDYSKAELASRCQTAKLIGDVLVNWKRHAFGRQTLVFAASVEHACALAAEFSSAGVPAEEIDGETPADERAARLERFRTGATRVLTNCSLFTEGLDVPGVQCVVLARPTKSVALYLQMLGRGLRRDAGKPDCIILDHATNVERLGMPDAPREWTLETTKIALPASASTQRERAVKKCPDCDWLIRANYFGQCEGSIFNEEQWSRCEHVFEAQPPAVVAADLEEVGIDLIPYVPRELQQDRSVRRLWDIARDRGYHAKWMLHVTRELTVLRTSYRERFGVPAPGHWLPYAIRRRLEEAAS